MSGSMVPILELTIRQLAGSRRVWLVLALVSLPVLGAVLFHVGDTTTSAAEFADDITATLIASAILPLVILLLATASFGNEVSDRTLVYIVLRPVARWRIALGKLVAALLVGGLPVAVSGMVAVSVIEGGDARRAAATGAGLLAGAAAYTAIFMWAGLATRHALVIGLVYVFVWEAWLAAYLDGIRFLSVRRFALALVSGLDSASLPDVELSLGAGVAGATIVLVGFAALTVRKLRRLDVP